MIMMGIGHRSQDLRPDLERECHHDRQMQPMACEHFSPQRRRRFHCFVQGSGKPLLQVANVEQMVVLTCHILTQNLC